MKIRSTKSEIRNKPRNSKPEMTKTCWQRISLEHSCFGPSDLFRISYSIRRSNFWWRLPRVFSFGGDTGGKLVPKLCLGTFQKEALFQGFFDGVSDQEQTLLEASRKQSFKNRAFPSRAWEREKNHQLASDVPNDPSRDETSSPGIISRRFPSRAWEREKFPMLIGSSGR